MTLLYNKEELPVASLEIVEDYDRYFMVVTFTVPGYPKDVDGFELSSDKTIKLHLLQAIWNDGVYNCTCCSVDTYSVINSFVSGFTGSSTLKNLMSKLGIKASVQDSTPTYWSIPACKMTSYISYLNTFTNISQGGGSRFFINPDGILNMIDFKKSFTFKPYPLKVTVSNDRVSSDWIISFPGVVKLQEYNGTNFKTEVLKIKEGFGIGHLTVNDTTGYETALLKQRLTNEFWIHYYTTRLVDVEVLENDGYSCVLGDLVTFNDLDTKFVIIGKRTVLNMGSQPPRVFLKLASYE